MKLSQQSLSIIESAIQKAVAKYTCNCEQTVVTDIHLQPVSYTHLNYAIVDEVDSVLIDDARTPLIISGPVPKGDDQLFEQLRCV